MYKWSCVLYIYVCVFFICLLMGEGGRKQDATDKK